VRLRWPDWERVTTLAWSPDGTRLAVGTETGAISLFDLSKGLAA
jgi:WD40 repeat protein